MSTKTDSQPYCQSFFLCRKFGTAECPFRNEKKTYEGCQSFEYKFYQPEMDTFAVSITRKEFLTLPMETKRRILREQTDLLTKVSHE